jgi:hypothetical protein
VFTGQELLIGRNIDCTRYMKASTTELLIGSNTDCTVHLQAGSGTKELLIGRKIYCTVQYARKLSQQRF